MINKKIQKLFKQINKRMKCISIYANYNYLLSTYKITVETEIGTFKINIAECDLKTLTVKELMTIVVDEIAEQIARELFRF